ncbi:E3 ubiquitin-protein ligase RNF146-A-like [Uranotaenia lowii]|uniref:E3 ubiquitin-protein ligase RNF146-A-like n=1 Tax=Uranotaenia lowii TaxID=190385 RepID=UPI00247A024C|nr:E3 ubiquitin-protein ligase RNF146-A-like [Uranotaenia lowii]
MAESLENSSSIASTSSGVAALPIEGNNVGGDEGEEAKPSSSAVESMAASILHNNNQQQADQTSQKPSDPEMVKMECPVCLQTCIHPARLPCGHVFCFLCVKGVAFKSRRCAMCRRDIPPSYLEHPQLVNGLREVEKAAKSNDGAEYQWYYEGRNGWWQYDERTSQELEESYQKKERFCKILVAGFLYIVDFEHKCQIRQNDPSRIRRVKRDLATIAKKGVAGLRLETNDLTSGANANPNSDGTLSSADLQAETNLMQMHRNIVVEESEEESEERLIRRINLNGSNSSETNNSIGEAFEETEASSSVLHNANVELNEAINDLNVLSLGNDEQRVADRVQESIPIRRRVVTELFSLSDSDDDNEDSNHIIL